LFIIEKVMTTCPIRVTQMLATSASHTTRMRVTSPLLTVDRYWSVLMSSESETVNLTRKNYV
jgi:hypothetical protein